MHSKTAEQLHSLRRPSRARANADARLAAAAAARAHYLTALKSRAARVGAHAAAVAAKERLRRVEESARRAAQLAAKLATAEARRNAHVLRARRARARRVQARRSRTRLVRERREATSFRRSELRDTRNLRSKHAAFMEKKSQKSTRMRWAVAKVEQERLLQQSRRALYAAGLKLDKVDGLSFEQLAQIVTNRPAQIGASRALRAIGVRSTHGHVRKLLAAIMVGLLPETTGNHKPMIARGKQLTCCWFFATPTIFARVWAVWLVEFDNWKKKDHQRLVFNLAADAVATDNAIAKDTQWKHELMEHQRRVQKAAEYIGGSQILAQAQASAKNRKDEAIIHEMLIDLPRFLQVVAQPEVISELVWSEVAQELTDTNQCRGPALRKVLSKLDIALNGMVPGCFVLPELNDSRFAYNVLMRAFDALRRCQSPAADDPLTEWLQQAKNRLSSGDIANVLRELSRIVFGTAGQVRSLRMRDIAPIVTQHGHLWEKDRFNERVANGEFDANLPGTRAFLQRAQGAERVKKIQDAVVQLVSSDEEIPEVLHLDAARVGVLRTRIDLASCIATITAVLLGLNIKVPSSSELRQVLQEKGEEVTILRALMQAPDELRELGTGALKRSLRGEPRKVFKQRIAEQVSRLIDTNGHEMMPSTLQVISEDIRFLVDETRRLTDVLIRVHGQRLNAMIV